MGGYRRFADVELQYGALAPASRSDTTLDMRKSGEILEHARQGRGPCRCLGREQLSRVRDGEENTVDGGREKGDC
ncbi:teneurin-3 isoform X1 [Lates japonicus]|uniref:Teneurin-3 isoform X1 n=1 Tax=Lates japonicus TaxID=270547 RepID=A0AAD3ME68_LATJO|nr:teneurin-3 isoform X1 [Lates japonicus]